MARLQAEVWQPVTRTVSTPWPIRYCSSGVPWKAEEDSFGMITSDGRGAGKHARSVSSSEAGAGWLLGC